MVPICEKFTKKQTCTTKTKCAKLQLYWYACTACAVWQVLNWCKCNSCRAMVTGTLVVVAAALDAENSTTKHNAFFFYTSTAHLGKLTLLFQRTP